MGDLEANCYYCERRGVDLRRCSRCKSVYYCTKVCQTLDWSGHKRNCVNTVQTSDPIKNTKDKKKGICRKGEYMKTEGIKISESKGHTSEHFVTRNFDTETIREALDSTIVHNAFKDSYKEGAYLDKTYVNRTIICQREANNKDTDLNDSQTNKERNETMRDINKSWEDQSSNSNSASNVHGNESQGDHKSNDNTDGLDRNICGFCSSSGCFKKCSRCKETFYCSSDCQRQDWFRHKNKCTNEFQGGHQSNDNTDGPERNICGFCSTSGCLKKCSRCKETFYCSSNCQRQDWDTHKSKCKNELQGVDKSNDNTDGPERKNCGFCSSSGCLKKCSRCKETFYCSSDCQRKDWFSHKSKCKKLSEEDERILRCWKKKQDHVAENKKMEENAPYSFVNYSGPSDRFYLTLTREKTLERATPPDGSLSNAVRKARMYFPLYDVVTDFDNIPSELMSLFSSSMTPPMYILVAFIYRYHEHAMRHGVYLKDARDKESKVEFYFDHLDDNPFPFFTYSEVKPGNYICVENPVMHRFMDGTVGIRINNPEHIQAYILLN